MTASLLTLATLVLPLLSAPQEDKAPTDPTAPDPITDEQFQAAWDKLTPEQKTEASEWFQAEARALPIFQNTLIAHIKGTLETDPYDWPAPNPEPVFDPLVHAPAQPIQRKPLDPSSAAYKEKYEEIVGWRAERRLKAAWKYDYAARTVVKLEGRTDPDRIFLNGIAGFPPDLDLAEAICQMKLDDGSLQASHAAFGHTYAMRTGTCYPGITLFDAWNAGRQIEMPDVECLGLLHTLLDDWKSFVAPVSGGQQRPLYAKIEALFVPLQRSRGLQISLARTYLIASPVLHDGYQATELCLHSLWETQQSDPGKLREELPPSDKWEKWFKAAQKKLRGDQELAQAAENRRQYLAYGEFQVRAVWQRVLEGMGTLETK